MGIRVLIADDDRLLREGIGFFLEKQSGIDFVAETGNGKAALRMAGEIRPDVVLMDVSVSDMNCIEAIRQIVSPHIGSRVLVLSSQSDIQLLLKALKEGACGLLMKSQASARELVEAIIAVATGENYLGAPFTGSFLRDYMDKRPENFPAGFPLISSREMEILQLVAEGRNTKEIAFTLDMSLKTVHNHRRNILKKLNLCGIAEMTKFAIREGIITM